MAATKSNICSVKECSENTRYAGGELCNKHYLRHLRYGRFDAVRVRDIPIKKSNKKKPPAEVKRLIKEVFDLYKNDKIRIETLINIFTE